MIYLRELYLQAMGGRGDVDAGQANWALVEAAIRLAKDTALLKDVVTLGALPLDTTSCTVALPTGRALVRVNKVEIQDPDDTDPEWIKVDPTAKVYLENSRSATDTLPVSARPSDWALEVESDTLAFPAPLDKAYPVRIHYAWSPKRSPEFDSVPFPEDAEDALVAYAESKIFRLAGAGQSIPASEAALATYKSKLPGLRSMADSGRSGTRSMFDFLPRER